MSIKRALRGAAMAATAMAAAVLAVPAQATDVDPGDYTPLPEGTNLAIVYGQFINRDQFELPDGTKLKDDTNLDTSVMLLRYVHFTKLGPFTIDPQIIVPIGSVHDAEIAGQDLGSDTGIGDPLVFATIWFVNKPGPKPTYIGFSPIVGIPIGSYDNEKPVNFGNNRWTFNPQVGIIQGLSDNALLDVIGDVTFYGDNNDSGPTSQRLKQDESYQLQSWLRYNLADKKTTLSVGYAGYWGGKQYLDGVYNGQAVDHQQLRLAAQTMVAPTLQLEAIVGRDIAVEDGFREAGRFQIRVLKIF